MPFSAGPLAQGKLADTQGVIYTVGFGAAAYVKQLFLYNTSSTRQTIDVWLNCDAPFHWRRLELDENESADLLEHGESLQLESGNTIEASSTDTDAVDFTITGVQET